jgi:ABC-type transport system substrate-binding protein
MSASGAAVGAQKSKIDKTAVLRFGAAIEGNGGVWFDPHSPKASAQNPSPRLWTDLIYDTMIHNTPDGKGEPGLATKWTTPDPKTIELTLREGVTFSDGTPFNAAAVKKAWDQLPATRPNLTANPKSIASIEAVGENLIRLNLNAPLAQTLIDEDLKNSNFFAVPSPTAEAAGNLDAKPVGAGPYLLDSYTTGKVVLKPNPSYWDPKAVMLGGIEFIDTAVGAPQVSALQANTVDLIWSIPPDSVETLKGGGFTVTSLPGGATYNLNLCPTSGVFASKEARQAVQWAVNRDDINKAALAGTGPPNETALTPQSPFFNKSLAKTYKFSPKKAKALLAKAGIAPGTKVTSVIPAQAPYSNIAEVVQSQLKDVGLDLQITKSTNFAADAVAAKPDLMVVGLNPTLFSLSFAGDTTVLNNCGWSNPEVIAALTTARDASKTTAEQKAAWDTLQKVVLDESPIIFTNQQGVLAAHTKKVKGVDIINAPYGPQLNRVYITK